MSTAMASILILVGTESGNAQMVADALKPVLGTAGHAVDVTDKAGGLADLQSHDVFLVVCATHGSGDIPTNMLPLAETLERKRPNLSGRRYGVIALGDMTYQDTFCGGGKTLDKMFARGWNYGAKGETWTADTTGSMTASGDRKSVV